MSVLECVDTRISFSCCCVDILLEKSGGSLVAKNDERNGTRAELSVDSNDEVSKKRQGLRYCYEFASQDEACICCSQGSDERGIAGDQANSLGVIRAGRLRDALQGRSLPSAILNR